ncbi:MAG TPA: alpha-amylase family protein [Terracidiphilus sp.]|nr:alpha-amylase family protein [Terracidiphilus sp.]
MIELSRRELLQSAGAIAAGTTLRRLQTRMGIGLPDGVLPSAPEWVRSIRLMIAEGYCPPFYPALDYDPKKAVEIARELGCNALRFPSFSYVAYFPTKTKLPRHQELGSRDLLRETADLCQQAGLKLVVYNPLNHPFMDITAGDPNYLDWTRRFADGRPMTTTHFGWGEYYEGCLNSPVREQTKACVREVITNYPVDLMYYDGAYEGMDHEGDFCHCKYCKEAYSQAHGKDIPKQDGSDKLEDLIEYRHWMEQEVVVAFMQEICTMVREVREAPQTYNNGEMMVDGWTAKAWMIPEMTTFMFEASRTPEQKFFNIRAGQSTGRNIWTYVGSHTVYNREHIKDDLIGGWFSHPIDGEQLQLDAAIATAAGAGYCYWGLNRLFYEPESSLHRPSIQGLKAIFEFRRANQRLFDAMAPLPLVGILLCTQAIRWYRDDKFVSDAYGNYYYGAFQVLKDLGYDSEPFLDYRMTPESLAKFKMVYVPNAPCLSEAQCATLSRYVENGGALLASHLTSIADEYGRPRGNYGLAELLGVKLGAPDPIVQMTDLYLRPVVSEKLIPQDPQVVRFEVTQGATVLAETYERGYRKVFGPAVVTKDHGAGHAIYIGSGLEAIYDETLNQDVLGYFHTLLDPILSSSRPYEVDFRQGLMPEFAASRDTLLLHLMADTGNIWKKRLVEETFLPVENVRVRIRIPERRQVRSIRLMWSNAEAQWTAKDGWVGLTVPRVHIYEVVRVDLA